MTPPDERFVREIPFGAFRSPAQIDRDRIVYSPHLARLAEVTQVRSVDGFLVHNRLTHSLKVAQIARRLAESVKSKQPQLAAKLGIDPDVAEAAGLAHDMGHPPFGHIAEEELDELVRDHGVPDGYEGNAQTFRILVSLSVGDTQPDDSSMSFLPGLNPTRATLNAVLKYPWLYQDQSPAMKNGVPTERRSGHSSGRGEPWQHPNGRQKPRSWTGLTISPTRSTIWSTFIVQA